MKMRSIIFIVFCLFLIVTCRDKALDEVTNEEYKLYSDYYNILIDKYGSSSQIDKLVFVNYTDSRDSLTTENITYLEKEFGFSLSEDIIKDYTTKNSKPYTLKNLFDLKIKYILVSSMELDTVFNKGGWTEFYKKYPNSQGRTYI
jgi:signal recognition particle receptor subunit beta